MLALARFCMAFSTAFVGPSSTAVPLQLRLVPNTIGTTFGMWLRTRRHSSRIFCSQKNCLQRYQRFWLSLFMCTITGARSGFRHYFTGLRQSPRYIFWPWSRPRFISRCLSTSQRYSLLQFLPRFLTITHNHRDRQFQFCEYAADADRDSLALRY